MNLAVDIGLTPSSAPWQVIFGLDVPAAAGRFLSRILPGILAGITHDSRTDKPVKSMISFPDARLPAIVSDADGMFNATVPPGEYKVQILASGYRMQQRKLVVASQQTETWDIKLNPREGKLNVTVSDAASGKPVSADIRFKDSVLPDGKTEPGSGQYSTALAPGKHDLTVSAAGYAPQELSLIIKDKDQQAQSVALQPLAVKKPEAILQTAAIPVIKNTVSERRQAGTAPRVVIKPVAPVVKISPEDLTSLYKTGVQQYMDEEYGKAIATFSTIVKADPGNAKARDYLKKAKERQKKISG
jgi:hypothetical protein